MQNKNFSICNFRGVLITHQFGLWIIFRSSCLTSVGDSDLAVSPLRHLAQDVMGLNNASNITEVKIILLADLVPDLNHFCIKEIESLSTADGQSASAPIFFLTPKIGGCSWACPLPSGSLGHRLRLLSVRGECMQECAMCLSASRTNGWWHSHSSSYRCRQQAQPGLATHLPT